MSPIRNQLENVIECLPEKELELLLEIAKRFVDDDVATKDDLEAINEAKKEYESGETVDHNDIDWN